MSVISLWKSNDQQRIRLRTEEILSDTQAGFRAGRSTIDQLFTLRRLAETYIEFSKYMSVMLTLKRCLIVYGEVGNGKLCAFWVTHSLTAALDQLRVVASSTSNDPGPRSRQHWVMKTKS